MATKSQGFLQGGNFLKLFSSERAFKELNISIATNTERDRVMAFTFPTENSHKDLKM
ncbi:hypothetical protein SESBI_48265 [Sesbania bispinosa]|nr:hypothetical protein SESBI_48265 [Sesbania bispinosa]